MIVVSDTSVITSLIQIGRAALLKELHETVLIPEAVQRELMRTHVVIPTFLETRAAQDRGMVARLETELDLGEAEAIVLAKEAQADLLLIDEKLGRRLALREGLRITGLMGLAVEAKRPGLVDSVRAMTAQLEFEAGFRVSDEVKEAVFSRAGE